MPFSCRNAVSENPSVIARERAAQKADWGKIFYAKSLLKDGDLVLRTGNDFISLTLRQFSVHNKTYSHCGLVRIIHGKIYIYNAIGGEDNPNARLRRDSFESFCNPEENLGFGIFQYDLTPIQHHRLDSIVDLYYKLRIKFDMKFDLKTDSTMYCAEFVYKAVTRATEDSAYMPLSHIGDFEYVAIDNLFLNGHTKPVYQAKFGQ
ncbi:MAG: hypothetical protein ACRDE2_02890 [Chitinophagaceae bacterium]